MNHTDDLSTELAIIGMSGRFPQAENLDRFWEKLHAGKELITFFSDEDLIAAGAEAELLKQPNFVKAGGVMDDIDLFDASFFGYTPREAEVLDPQHRHFLECAWEALENAGYDPDTYSKAIGVFAGCSISNYFLQNLISHPELVQAMGNFQLGILNDKDYLATRISYKLNLRGPSINVQTACSTSLVAIHMACQSVLNGECDMALAGGVSISLLRKMGYLYQEGGISSPDGHCRAFDARGQGIVGGNGVGVIAIKRLEDALADRDNILAVIKGSAINNDGSAKIGFTAPSVEGQVNVISDAQSIAGIDAETISYVEAHGTGTALGDPIEVTALTKAFRATTDRKGFCGIGSVKTNLGHLDAAAGVAGIIKTVLALKHKILPPTLHFETPNPRIDFENSPFYVVSKPSVWLNGNGPRRAAVSSFGIGGTNAHAILEEAPVRETSAASRPSQLLVLSAKTPTALETATSNLVQHLRTHPDIDLADVAFTLQVGRRGFEYRRYVVCRNAQDAAHALEQLDPRRVSTGSVDEQTRSIAFMFTGQGSQYPGMSAGLYEHEPVFRFHVDECAELLKPRIGRDLRDVIYPPETEIDEAAAVLTQTSITQPALFVVEYALAQLLMSWGIRPEAMIGHSIGEYVAACLAGVFSLEDALVLVAERGRLMQRMPAGAMLSVRMSEEEVRPLLGRDLSLAAVNAPSQCVVAGPFVAVEKLEKELAARKVDCTRLRTSHAFHSEMMKPMLATFIEKVSAVERNAPGIRFVSNVTGTWITAAQATDPNYWAMHLAQTVRFADGVQTLIETGAWLLEVGPGQTLTRLAQQQTPSQPKLATLRRPQETAADEEILLTTLGRLWQAGIKIDWQNFYAEERRGRVPLPAYPFERERYWIEPGTFFTPQTERRAGTGKLPDVADWFYRSSWKQSSPLRSQEENETPASWLIFVDEEDLGSCIVERLERAGHDLILVRAAKAFSRPDERTFCINPVESTDYETLIGALHASGNMPQRVLHLWSVSPPDPNNKRFDEIQDQGFYSLLSLTRALEKLSITEAVQIVVVSASMQDVSGGERFSPAKQTLLATCQVVPQEYPNIRCRSVDVNFEDSRGKRAEKLADQLFAELTAATSDLAIAYRGMQRWTRTFEPVRLTERLIGAAPARLRREGNYLIVGSGPVSSVLAEYLTSTVQARVSVVDTDQVRTFIDHIEDQYGQLHGVFYTAAIDTHESRLTIGEASRHELNQRLQIALQPLFALEEALHDKELDFCILMSSLSAVLGGLGLLSRTAQGILMDAIAARQNQIQSMPWISIDWDVWEFAEDNAASGMTPAEAMKALGRVLGHRWFSPVIVSTGDLPARIARWINPESARDNKEEKATASPANYPRPNLPYPFVAPSNELEKTVVEIWQSLLGINGIGVNDNLFDLGGDSLLAIQILSRIRETLHCEIALRSIFETPTVAGVVENIEQNQHAQFETIDEVVDLVEQLSEDELRLLIAEHEQLLANAQTSS
ncbi:MAG TPA: beta-ketoacyl synthase N-terminal-like domain-containing protein [Pyrinomonadaceae bacterium]|nr:beta-ketoacyl synthase N-terminal-like domain-containing protein [Pyrinomonadaceae bacterium]